MKKEDDNKLAGRRPWEAPPVKTAVDVSPEKEDQEFDEYDEDFEEEKPKSKVPVADNKFAPKKAETPEKKPLMSPKKQLPETLGSIESLDQSHEI